MNSEAIQITLVDTTMTRLEKWAILNVVDVFALSSWLVLHPTTITARGGNPLVADKGYGGLVRYDEQTSADQSMLVLQTGFLSETRGRAAAFEVDPIAPCRRVTQWPDFYLADRSARGFDDLERSVNDGVVVLSRQKPCAALKRPPGSLVRTMSSWILSRPRTTP